MHRHSHAAARESRHTGYTAEITQQHPGTNTTINPAEGHCEKQCGDTEAKPNAITMKPRKRHNTPTQPNPCRIK